MPRHENSKVAPSLTVRLHEPSDAVIVPFVVPWIMTVTPASGRPSESFTPPLAVLWA